MNFNQINFDEWARKEHFLHYDTQVNCSHSLTFEINVKQLLHKLRKGNYNFYRAFIYIVSKAVNSIENFKMGVDENGNIGFYDFVSPLYLIFHDDTKTFSGAVTEYNNSFEVFYENITKDFEKYKNDHRFFVTDIPQNLFNTSCLPWIKYTGFNLTIPINHKHYSPIITWGRYEKEKNKIKMPITIQINHAAADGYHSALLLNEIQKICNEFKK
jgi:chloramphenicol O-acetyltransferase type A